MIHPSRHSFNAHFLWMGKRMQVLVLSLIVWVMSIPPAKSQRLRFSPVETNTRASFRGLSVVDDLVAWVGGTRGTVCRTTNGGLHFTCSTVPGYDSCDFRSVYGFDASRALICHAGSPAVVLLTQDGGQTWKEVYRNDHPDAFIDGIDFISDREGFIYGDPIQGNMMVLHTTDGGVTWSELPATQVPHLNTGEASFAASGTGIRCTADSVIWIATGGAVSRLWRSMDFGKSWNSIAVPVIQGTPSRGIFSLAVSTGGTLVVTGGDYLMDTLATDHVFVSADGGLTWTFPAAPTRGYRECAEWIEGTSVIAVGPGGMDITHDGGQHWMPLNDMKQFHVVRKARTGNRIIAAGGKGQIVVDTGSRPENGPIKPPDKRN